MKLSFNWLKDYVNIDMPPEELGHFLTMAGLEVEGIEAVGQSLQDIIAVQIIKVEPHPNADQLSICQVDRRGERLQVVCGAPNLEKGGMVPLALPGTKLPDGTCIEETKIRGEISTGMLLAEDEMGLTDDHKGIMVLPDDIEAGSSLGTMTSLADWVFDVDITPNRPDCASVIGVAREIAAATGQKVRAPVTDIKEEGPDIDELAKVAIKDPEGCPRYAAGLIQDIHLDDAPFWMRYRLYLSGIRSINNLVDVTNYVMLEMGQPLHAFDFNRLRGNRIVVRRAEEGEVFSTLDGESHTLNREILMICDADRAVAIAGIMGGLNSEIFAGTRNVLIESAFFDPITIRRGSKSLGLSTEASYRFERGADIGGATEALKRAIYLINLYAGGKTATGLIDNYPKKSMTPYIDLRVDKTNSVLGTSISGDVMGGYFKALEMEVSKIDDNVMKVKPPSFRVDITRDVDLIEEVARLSGYDNIPITYPSIRPSEKGDSPELDLRDQSRAIMAGLGFSEIITYSFIAPETVDILEPEEKDQLTSFVRLLKPLTVEQSVMRTTLLPGLMDTARTNILNNEKELKLFEWGKIFIRNGDQPQPFEKISLAALVSGLYHQKRWYGDERMVDFYDIKGAVEAFLKGLGAEEFQFKKVAAFPGYNPDVSAGIYCAGSLVGRLGQVSPSVMAAYNIEKVSAYIFELDIDLLQARIPGIKKFQPFAKYPAVYRDISIIVKRTLESSKIIEIIREAGGDLVENIQIFDLYEGKKIDPSEKALAFKICYRSKNKTLDGNEMNLFHESVIDRIKQETGGRLKEG